MKPKIFFCLILCLLANLELFSQCDLWSNGPRPLTCCQHDTIIVNQPPALNDTLCLDSLLLGSNHNEYIEITNGVANIVLDADGSLDLQNGSNTYTIDDTGPVGVGKNPNPLVDFARMVVEGYENVPIPVMLIKSNFNNIPVNTGVVGLNVISQYASGSGYAIQATGGKRAINAINDGGSQNITSYGIYSSSTGTAGIKFGVYGKANSVASNGTYYGVYGEATGNGILGLRYGIYGKAFGGATNYAGYFQGNVTVTGTFLNPSDKKLKENIQYENSVLKKIRQLKPAEYNFKQAYVNKMNLPMTIQHGLIAEELENVFPELVSEIIHPAQYNEREELVADEIAYKGINYFGLIPILIQSIKEQQDQIESQQTEIKKSNEENAKLQNDLDEIKSRLNKLDRIMEQCCQLEHAGEPTSNIKSENKTDKTANQSGYLEQNIPNPFGESTVIHYSIPYQAGQARINILSTDHKLIKTYPVSVISKGVLTISARSLSAGTYIYELIVDEKVLDSKMMVLVK